MTAIQEFKITKLLKRPIFKNEYPEDALEIIRVLRYVSNQTGACHYSLCAAAGITVWQIRNLDGYHGYQTAPQELEPDGLGWYVAAVLRRAGFTDADIYGQLFPAHHRYRHERWQRIRLPNLLQETEATLRRVMETEAVYVFAEKHRLRFKDAFAKYKENITSSWAEVRDIWRNVFELSSFAGVIKRKIKRGTLRLNHPRWVRGERSQETVKVFCRRCNEFSPMRIWRIVGKAGVVKTCDACPIYGGSVCKEKTHYVVNILEGYRYLTIEGAYYGLNVQWQEHPLTLQEFSEKLRREKYVCLNGIFLWYKKRTVKLLGAEGRKRLEELGLPKDFRMPEGVYTKAQREHYRKRKRNAKRKTRAVEKEKKRQEELVTVNKIVAYREMMKERAELIRKQTMAEDRI